MKENCSVIGSAVLFKPDLSTKTPVLRLSDVAYATSFWLDTAESLLNRQNNANGIAHNYALEALPQSSRP